MGLQVNDVAQAMWELYRDGSGRHEQTKLTDLGNCASWLSVAEHAQTNLLRLESSPAHEVARQFWNKGELGLEWQYLSEVQQLAFQAVVRMLAGLVMDFDEHDRLLPLNRLEATGDDIARGLTFWRNWIKERAPAATPDTTTTPPVQVS